MMGKIFIIGLVLTFISGSALAQTKKVNEYGEEEAFIQDTVEQAAPQSVPADKKTKVIEEKSIGTGEKAKAPAKTQGINGEAAAPKEGPKMGPNAGGREGLFRAGIVGPGVAVVNQGVGAAMTIGAEGEYFFYEKFSAGLRAEVATKFTNTAIVSFVPFARYVFDFERFPRWAAYVQAGVGGSVYRFAGSTYGAVDIAIPTGGFWWQWTDRFSVGADASLHVFVYSAATAVGFQFAPTFRYLF